MREGERNDFVDRVLNLQLSTIFCRNTLLTSYLLRRGLPLPRVIAPSAITSNGATKRVRYRLSAITSNVRDPCRSTRHLLPWSPAHQIRPAMACTTELHDPILPLFSLGLVKGHRSPAQVCHHRLDPPHPLSHLAAPSAVVAAMADPSPSS